MDQPHLWKPGESGNPAGRKIGSPNKRSRELELRLRDRGDVDPADFCSSIVSSTTEPTELKLQAANYLLPYLYNKRGPVVPSRYIDEPVDLPRPTTLEQANANIALISEMKALGHIDLDFANSLIADNRAIADNLIAQEELRMKLADHSGTGNQRIIIEGGLPTMPGHENLIMPHQAVVNGQTAEVNGKTIDHQTTELPAPDPEPCP